MRKKVKTITLHTVGWMLIPIGGLGLIIPIIPGIVCIILGLMILSHVSPTMHRFLESIRRKSPICDSIFGKLDTLYGRFFNVIKS